jgi:hypothetical protein
VQLVIDTTSIDKTDLQSTTMAVARKKKKCFRQNARASGQLIIAWWTLDGHFRDTAGRMSRIRNNGARRHDDSSRWQHFKAHDCNKLLQTAWASGMICEVNNDSWEIELASLHLLSIV